jgi:hypothetical protein
MKAKKAVGFYFTVVDIALEVIAVILLAMMSETGKAAIYATAIVGIVLQAAVLVLAQKQGDARILDAAGIVIAVLYMASTMLLIQSEMSVVVNVFANHVGTVSKTFLMAAAAFLGAAIVQIISGYLPMTKESSAQL